MDETMRARIFAVADEMYAENGKTRLPTVADVRKRAKADMNDACSAMKEWRLRQGKKVGTVATTPLPPELQASGISALAEFWQEATSLASESLIAAQAAWDAEKQVSEEMCQQIAADFDVQAAELEGARQEIRRLMALAQQHAEEMLALRDQMARISEERDSAQRALNDSLARAGEARRRVEELETAVGHAREDVAKAREQADALRAAHSEQVDRARAEFREELASERSRLELERQRYEELAHKATVEAATLRGRLEAMEAMEAAAVAAAGPKTRSPKRVPNGGAGRGGQG